MPETPDKIAKIADIAEVWLDAGDAEKARPLLKDAVKSYDTLPYSLVGHNLLTQLMRVEPEVALARIQKVPTSSRFLFYGGCCARAHSRSTGRGRAVLQSRAGGRELGIWMTMRLCKRLARVDPLRARRFAESLRGPGERVCGWAFVALGLAEKDQAGAREALDHAIEGIERLWQLDTTRSQGLCWLTSR